MTQSTPRIDPLMEEADASARLPWLLVAGAGVAAALMLLLWLGWEIGEGEGFAFEPAIMLAMRVAGHPDQPVGPAWLPSMIRDITALGSTVVLTLWVAMAASFLWLRGLKQSMLLLLMATIGGSVMVTLIKALVGRARPDVIGRLMVETSNSFPSGHAALSAIVYLSIAALFWPLMRRSRERVWLLAAMMLLVGAIGVSRVYLGVHWPSDVLAGWIFGSLWALAWWRIELRVIRRRSA